jgi:hypothetical protein
MSPSVLKGLNLDFLKMFTIHYKLRQSLNQKEVQNQQQIEEEINKIEINMMEDAHSKFESMGDKITSCRELDDLNFLNNEDDFFETNMFLCFQYFRTRSIKQNVLKSFGSHEVQQAEKYWNIISFVMATVLARNLSLDKKIRFLLFENQTGTPFITSDQPIFNILNDKVNEKGEVIELEFYYPLSPYRALSVHFNHQSEKIDRAIINEQTVNWFNNKVVENSEYFVFANNQSQLDLLIR